MQVEQATVSALRLFTAQPWVSSLSVGISLIDPVLSEEKAQSCDIAIASASSDDGKLGTTPTTHNGTQSPKLTHS
jgi:hypothetical protein